MITYNAENVRLPKIRKRDTTAWIKAVAAEYGRKVGDVGYMFVDDDKILEVNREYLGHDYYTDVITFDYDEDDIVSGDIVISLDTVRSNAALFGKTKMHVCHSLDEALDKARHFLGQELDVRTIIMPHGASTLPKLAV